MKTSSILDTYQTWLTHWEYSPATIQKYTKALTRFFADTGAGDIPTRETVAAWRDKHRSGSCRTLLAVSAL